MRNIPEEKKGEPGNSSLISSIALGLGPIKISSDSDKSGHQIGNQLS